MTGTRPGGDFLTIDMEALLRKVPGRSFRSPHHYPIEMIRASLARGAGRVDVSLGRGRIVIEDDGPAIAIEAIESLAVLLDPAVPAAIRHQAMASLEEDRSSRLLAALAPSPSEIRIRAGGREHVLKRGAGPASLPCRTRAGTGITIVRRARRRGERVAIEDHCRHARAEIVVDGRLVSRCGPPPDAVAAASLPTRPGTPWGLAWIPREGDMCRVLLLDQGIRRDQIVLPALEGMVLEAAVECTDDAPGDLLRRLGEAAAEMYRDMARAPQPASLRARIEELLFMEYRRSQRHDLLDAFAPFAVMGGGRISLSGVRALAARGALRSIRSDDDPARYLTGGSTVLVLTEDEWEFLADVARIPLSRPAPAPRADPWYVRLLERARDAIAEAGDLAVGLEPIREDLLSPEERRLVDSLSRHVLAVSSTPVDVRMVRGGRAPGRMVDRGGRRILAVSRGHRHVAMACRAVLRDPANVEMAWALLARGRPPTPRGGASTS